MDVKDQKKLQSIMQEFYGVVNSIVGVFFDAKAGFNLNVQKISEFQKKALTLLEDTEHGKKNVESMDSAWFIVGKGNPNDSTAQSFHQTTQREFKVRNADFGSNSKFVGNFCLIAIYQFWEDEYRNKLAKFFRVKKNHVQSDLFGDLRMIRNSILHHNTIAKNEIKKCKILKWFSPNDEISIDEEKLLQVVSHLNRLRLEIREPEPCLVKLWRNFINRLTNFCSRL